MALSVLDGNQSATTLSSVVTGGEHIVAHSVVSLGTTAIANITSAVSGVNISGTVTVGNSTTASAVAVRLIAEDTNPGGGGAGVNVNLYSNDNALLVDALKNGNSVLGYDALSSYVQVKPAIGSSITIGSIPSISGTVTANINGTPAVTIPQLNKVIASVATDGVADATTNFVKIGGHQDGQNQISHIVHVSAGGAMKVDASDSSVTFGAVHGTVTISNFPSTQTIAGTVTVGALNVWDEGNQDYSVVRGFSVGDLGSALQVVGCDETNLINGRPSLPVAGTVTVGSSVTIGSLPAISGTVTANSIFPRVTLIDGSGTVTTANTAITVFASSSTRSYLLVQVTTGSAFVNVGATATTVNGINLTAGQGYSWETTIPQGIVSLISTTTNSRYVAKEA